MAEIRDKPPNIPLQADRALQVNDHFRLDLVEIDTKGCEVFLSGVDEQSGGTMLSFGVGQSQELDGLRLKLNKLTFGTDTENQPQSKAWFQLSGPSDPNLITIGAPGAALRQEQSLAPGVSGLRLSRERGETVIINNRAAISFREVDGINCAFGKENHPGARLRLLKLKPGASATVYPNCEMSLESVDIVRREFALAAVAHLKFNAPAGLLILRGEVSQVLSPFIHQGLAKIQDGKVVWSTNFEMLDYKTLKRMQSNNGLAFTNEGEILFDNKLLNASNPKKFLESYYTSLREAS